MAGNNADFRLPGEGRVLGLSDLYHDTEGQQVAKGYLQYLKELTALKQVRDHSRLNQHTPLLPTSLVDIEQEGPWPTPMNYDGSAWAQPWRSFVRTAWTDLSMPITCTPIPGTIARVRRLPRFTGSGAWRAWSIQYARRAANHAGLPNGDSPTTVELVHRMKLRVASSCRK
jgi:hypothetical protein